MQPSQSRGHVDHLPVDLLLEQPAGGDGEAGPLDPIVHLVPGLPLDSPIEISRKDHPTTRKELSADADHGSDIRRQELRRMVFLGS